MWGSLTDQAVLERPNCKLCPRPQTDLVENMRDVRLDSADREDQPFRNFFVSETLRDQQRDILLALSER